MRRCLFLAALVALLAGCAEVDDLDESRPVPVYRGPISGPMSGPIAPVTPNTLGLGDAGAPGDAAPGESGR